VTIGSRPAGAHVFVDGAYAGQTPLQLRLDARKPHLVFLRLAGYQDRTVQIDRHLGIHWLVLDTLALVAPIVIDAITGAWFQLEDVEAALVSQPEPPSCPPGFVNDAPAGEVPICRDLSQPPPVAPPPEPQSPVVPEPSPPSPPVP